VATAHGYGAAAGTEFFDIVNPADHSATGASDAATIGSYSDYFGSVCRKHRAGDLSRGELRLGRSHLDQKSGWFFNGLGSPIARLQTLPHLFADDLTGHKKAQNSVSLSTDYTDCFIESA
jgi:hypothetical protein